jgi:hypothetical protein
MVALAGIELLSRMAQPPHNSFVGFAVEYSAGTGVQVNDEEAKILRAFRNALSHTFGLFHVDSAGVIPIFLFDQNSTAPVVMKVASAAGIAWEICIDSLVELFLVVIRQFEAHLRADQEAKQFFLSAFSKYGRLHYRSTHVVPRR